MAISVDCGRYAVKSVGSRKLTFPSVVGEWRQRKISEGGNYDVAINGNRYFIGELAQQESRFARDMTTRSKIHEETKILTLTAIALQAETERVKLVTGLPVDQHTDGIKAELRRLLSGIYDLEVNGIKKHIRLAESDIIVSIEGAGAYMAESPPGKCRVIDAGSRTINTLTIDENKKYRDLQSGTLDYGCMDLAADDKTEQFSRRIITDLSKLWVKYSGELVLLTGGGAGILEPYLCKHFNVRQVSNPVYANAIGYHALGVRMWQK
jgi:plasmid segregation protein ParM